MSLRDPGQIYTTRPEELSLRMGWDGWTGWDGMGYQKFLSIFFILSGYIKHVYVYLYVYLKIFTIIVMGLKYIYTQKLSPTFLWVSEFHVKLGVVVKNFKINAGR